MKLYWKKFKEKPQERKMKRKKNQIIKTKRERMRLYWEQEEKVIKNGKRNKKKKVKIRYECIK